MKLLKNFVWIDFSGFMIKRVLAKQRLPRNVKISLA